MTRECTVTSSTYVHWKLCDWKPVNT